MGYMIQFSGKSIMGWLSSGSHLKSTQDKMERQANRDEKVAYFQAQKENLKNREATTVEEIARKLEMLHNYDDQIAAAKQEYNSSQMLHLMDEAQERGEKIAKAVEKSKPKTEEERRQDAVDEALGIEDSKGELTESMEKLSAEIEKLAKEATEDIPEEIPQEVPEELPENAAGNSDGFSTEKIQEEGLAYRPFDIRV